MKVKEAKVEDSDTLHSRIDQLYTVCQSLTVDSIAKDEDIAHMSRECGELRIKLENLGNDLQKSQTTARQEIARSRAVLAEMIKSLDAIPQTVPSSPSRILPNESLSSELSRFQVRFKLLISMSTSSLAVDVSKTLSEKDARICELEAAIESKDKELLQSSSEFNIKLLDMRKKMDILNGEFEVLQSK